MKNIFLLLILMAVPALAVPTGTVTRAVVTDTNGVLTGSSTNFAVVNALASSGTVAAVFVDLTTVSNLTVSAISSAAVARASADAAWKNSADTANYTWTSDGKGITITGYSGGEAMTIPSRIDGLPVVAVNAFAIAYNGTVTSLVIPDSVTFIGNGAFKGCNALASVVIGNGVSYIGSEAFKDCEGLVTVKVGSALVTIGSEAFSACISLTTLSMPATVATVGNQAFASCVTLATVYWTGNSPSPGTDVFKFCTSVGTNHVTNPGATGWSSTFGNRPVIYGYVHGNGVNMTGITPWSFGAAWHTNTVVTSVETNELGAVTNITTGTIIYLGTP